MTEPKTKSQVRYACPKCDHVFLPSLREKQSRAGKASRRKGANFENKKAKEITKWWNQDKTEYEFKRTPMSGGSALKDGFDMAGDICTNAPDFRFSIECKNAPSSFTGLHNFFSEKAKVWSWFKQANDDCPVDRVPLLIINRFDMPTYCAIGTSQELSMLATDLLDGLEIQFYKFQSNDKTVVIWQYYDMLKTDPDNWVINFRECTQCHRILPVSSGYFSRQKTGKYGFAPQCKKCAADYRRINKELIDARVNRWRSENPDKFKAQRKRWRDEYNNRPYVKAQRKLCDKLRNADPTIKERKNNRLKEKYWNDINYRMRMALSARLNSAVNKKSSNTLDLLGCTLEEFTEYIESLFLPGMTWDNYGLLGWHIDHIKPCAVFDLSDPTQQEACFHYTNLQPLWAKDNLTKADMIESDPENWK